MSARRVRRFDSSQQLELFATVQVNLELASSTDPVLLTSEIETVEEAWYQKLSPPELVKRLVDALKQGRMLGLKLRLERRERKRMGRELRDERRQRHLFETRCADLEAENQLLRHQLDGLRDRQWDWECASSVYSNNGTSQADWYDVTEYDN